MGLVLTRRYGDEIIIGDNISIRVGKGRREGSVRLLIEAPREIPIIRGELREQTTAKQEVESDASRVDAGLQNLPHTGTG